MGDDPKEDVPKEDAPAEDVPKETVVQQSFGFSPDGRELSLALERVSSDQRVGLDLQNYYGDCKIYTVKPKGLVEQWNKENPTMQIVAGDFIKEVNGLTKYEEMRRVLLKEDTLHLTIGKK